MPTATDQFGDALRIAAPDFGVKLSQHQFQKLTKYYELVLKWNPRLHLIAPCSPEEFATRHVLESLMLLKQLPVDAKIADIGSGGGLPILPCLLVRDDLQATLIESSLKKTVFLKEALRRIVSPQRAQVLASRFEDTAAPDVGFITCRALEKFGEMLAALVDWAPPGAAFLLFAGEALRIQVELKLRSVAVELIPRSEARFLITARKE